MEPLHQIWNNPQFCMLVFGWIIVPDYKPTGSCLCNVIQHDMFNSFLCCDSLFRSVTVSIYLNLSLLDSRSSNISRFFIFWLCCMMVFCYDFVHFSMWNTSWNNLWIIILTPLSVLVIMIYSCVSISSSFYAFSFQYLD